MKAHRVLVAAGVGLVARAVHRDGWRLVAHDLVAHPLSALVPEVGERFHDRLYPDSALLDEMRAAFAGSDPLLGVDWSEPPRRCVGCGCTDDRACPGGCVWVLDDPPVCSSCSAAAQWPP